ncbi:MAG: beta-galactosidase, partial [Bacteroidetes bacterium]|nr:beta-galactosidase [Bacteroidota bacterium]
MKRIVLSLIVVIFVKDMLLAQGIGVGSRAVVQGVKGAVRGRKHSFSLGDSSFLLDGKPLQIISGDMHYPRVPREYWRDRLRMAKAMGLNTIGTYVFWNVHEPEKGKYDFAGNNDIAEFVRIAGEEGLWVVLRPSPYVCAEWEFGGYPYWLLKDSTVKVRSKDPRFIAAYRSYVMQLGRQLAPLLVTHGGNVLMVQMENEYGSYSDDKSYLDLNRQLFRDAGFDGVLFTCDGATQMPRGYLPGYLPAVNGEEDPATVKALINKYHGGKGPYYIAEWYPGWFDDWGKPHAHTGVEHAAAVYDKILGAGISVNIYMFHGGTTRGFMNGANMNQHSPYSPQVSSYDYDAPLDEAGNPTEKYYAFRKVIEKHLPAGQRLPPVPARKVAVAIPPIRLTGYAGLFDNLPAPVASRKPLCFEDLGQGYGYVLYRTVGGGSGSGWLRLKQLRDYAIVYVNGRRQGTLDRRLRQDSVWLDGVPAGAVLDILVENNGRINYGPYLADNRQGITEAVTWNGQELYNWNMYRLPMDGVARFRFAAGKGRGDLPGLYKGSFTVGVQHDVYLDMRGFGKGVVFLNGRNLGKYWQIGPQQTIYVPAGWLRKGGNEVVVFDELEGGHGELKTLAKPILDSLSQEMATRYPIIPWPTTLWPADGEFVAVPGTVLVRAEGFEKEAVALNQLFGGGLVAGARVEGRSCIEMRKDERVSAEEGYTLMIRPGHVVLAARTAAGMFRGVETVRQLLPVVMIHGALAYVFGGIHLDVLRHFFSIDYLRKF